MKIDNKTILIIGLIFLATIGVLLKQKDFALAIGSGLVGYLSKDSYNQKS